MRRIAAVGHIHASIMRQAAIVDQVDKYPHVNRYKFIRLYVITFKITALHVIRLTLFIVLIILQKYHLAIGHVLL